MITSELSVLYVGVDIAKDTVVVAAHRPAQLTNPVSLSNDAAGYVRLQALVSDWQTAAGCASTHLVMEPTGGYEARLAYYAHAQGWRVSLVNPSQVRDWIRGLARRAKTDCLDAALLARFGAERHPAPWQPPAAEWTALQQLLARREDYLQMVQAERNRAAIFALLPHGTDRVRDSLHATTQHLAEALVAIESAIDDLFHQHPPMQQQAERLDTIPGVGPKTIPPLLALCARLYAQSNGQGTAKQLTALAGLDPQVYQSGTSVQRSGRISKKGDPVLRRTLYMASLGGTRGRNPLSDFYRHLVARGKPKKLALIACARKILVWAWAVFTSQQPFDPAKAASRGA